MKKDLGCISKQKMCLDNFIILVLDSQKDMECEKQ